MTLSQTGSVLQRAVLPAVNDAGNALCQAFPDVQHPAYQLDELRNLWPPIQSQPVLILGIIGCALIIPVRTCRGPQAGK